MKKTAAARPVEKQAVAVVRTPAGWMIRQRPLKGRLAGMWEFPSAPPGVDESSEEAALRVARTSVGSDVDLHANLGTTVHAFTHVTVEYEAFLGYIEDPNVEVQEGIVADDNEIAAYALPSAQQKILTLARNESG